MEMNVRKSNGLEEKADVLVVTTFQEKQLVDGIVKEIDVALGGLVMQILKEESFLGKANQTLWVRTDGMMAAKRVLIVGLGKKEEVDLEVIRLAAATSLHAIRTTTARNVVSILPVVSDCEVKEIAHAFVEGVQLASYTFGRYKKQKKDHLKSFDLVTKDGRDVVAVKKGMELARLFSRGTCFVRDLVNTTPHHMNPTDLVQAAKVIAKESVGVQVKIFDESQLKRMGAGAILGVAQGSIHPPYLVHLTYKPKTKSKKCIALVGKGVTFDSGGLSLKPPDAMITMKCDMAGAADVLGVFSVIAELAPSVEVHGIFAAVENMPSGNAIRPGDIVTAMNKKTIEVLNTDAEGRLILADALVYTGKLKPDLMIDLATLTGACVVALGEEITGVMSNDPKLANQILAASAKAGEKMWELPLEKKYRKLIEGEIGDIKNVGGRWGGALTAGLFLQEFVDAKMPWAHLDIAGPAFAERDYNAYEKKGATGHGVRTLLRFLQLF